MDWKPLVDAIPEAHTKIGPLIPRHMRSHYDADDAIGDALFIISQRPDYFDYSRPVALLIWLARGAIGVERRRPRSRVILDPTPIDTGRSETAHDVPSTEPGPGSHLDAESSLDRIMGMCHDAGERRVISLLASGYAKNEIAKIVGWNESTVYRLIRRIRRAMG